MTERARRAAGAGRERAALPAAGRGRDRLRHLHARSRTAWSPTGTPAPSASRATRADEIIGRHFSRFYTPEDRARRRCRRARSRPRAREGRFEAEGWRVRKDGSRFWASVVIDAIRDETAGCIGFAKITRDVTERNARRGGAARERAAVPPAGEGRDRLRALHARPERHGHQLERRRPAHQGLCGRARSSASTSRASTPTPTGPRACRRGRCATPREQGRFEAEGWRVRKDGTLFWASVVIDAIRDEDGELIGFAKITRDITERREAQLDAAEGAGAAGPGAEDGGARPAHRRRRARLQQPADGRERPGSSTLQEAHRATIPRLRAPRSGRSSRRSAARR